MKSESAHAVYPYRLIGHGGCSMENFIEKCNPPVVYHHKGIFTPANAFVHIPKTGGTTLNGTALRAYQTRVLNHTPAKEARQDENSHDFFLYTIMRNPYERLLSCFYFTIPLLSAIAEEGALHDQIAPFLADVTGNLKFKDYVRYITGNSDRGAITHTHWIPQSEWIKDEKGNVIVNYIGRTEALLESVNEISYILGVPPNGLTELPRLNASSSRDHYSNFFDAECRKMAEEYYAEDIEFLKVKFENA